MATNVAKLPAVISPEGRNMSRAALTHKPLSYQLNLTSVHSSLSCSAALLPTSTNTHTLMHTILPVICIPIPGTTFCLPHACTCNTFLQERIERAINRVPTKAEMFSVSDISI